MRKVLFIVAILSLVAVVLVPLASGVVAQDPEPVELEGRRHRTSKTFDNLDGTYTLLVSGGSIHYQDEYGDWQDIDNGIAAATSPWDYEMTQDVYTAKFLSDFTAGQVARWEMEDHYLTFQPMGLEWTNDLNQIDLISMPQDMAEVIINEPQLTMGIDAGYRLGTIRWDNAYGAGRDFYWVCDTSRLRKVLELPSALPAPPQYIVDGGNPVARLSFIFDSSEDLDIYVDGDLWNRDTRETTLGNIEFVPTSSNQSIWSFASSYITDSSGNETFALNELRRVGSSLYISVRVPYDWLEKATYPVYIDPEISPYSSTGDGHILVNNSDYDTARDASSGSVYTSYTYTYIGQFYMFIEEPMYTVYRSYFYFDTSDIGSGDTINDATLYLWGVIDGSYTDFNIVIQDGQPTYPSSTLQASDYNRTYYSGTGSSYSTSGGWSTISYNDIDLTEAGEGMITKAGTTKICVRSSRDISGSDPTQGEYVRAYTSDYSGETRDPYLYVDYSTAAAGYPYSWGTIIG